MIKMTPKKWKIPRKLFIILQIAHWFKRMAISMILSNLKILPTILRILQKWLKMKRLVQITRLIVLKIAQIQLKIFNKLINLTRQNHCKMPLIRQQMHQIQLTALKTLLWMIKLRVFKIALMAGRMWRAGSMRIVVKVTIFRLQIMILQGMRRMFR